MFHINLEHGKMPKFIFFSIYFFLKKDIDNLFCIFMYKKIVEGKNL